MWAPLDLVSAHPWRRAIFTTYALSLAFFEAVVLDALVRGGSREALILADVDGVRGALSEQGARRVGKDYDLEPVAVRSGVFHPKISILSADGECHLLVGSGNLTFGGWGGNFEIIEHLHPSFASDALEDAAEFFELMTRVGRIRHGAAARCSAIADELRASTRGQPRNGNIRLFHSLNGSIAQKLAETADDLGGAVRLVTAVPYWDDGSAIDALCAALNMDDVFVHAHSGGTVEGRLGSNWPRETHVAVEPVRLDIMKEKNARRLHAKVFEVVCKRGRILLSGSANATNAALGSNANVEACVARIQRERRTGWTFSTSQAPELRIASDEEVDDDTKILGVLRAVLDGDRIVGQVLSPQMSGVISVFQLTTEGAEPLGKTNLASDATFSLTAPRLEVQSWSGGRLVLQIRSADGRRAEGFVSVAAFTEISRRAGAIAPRLLAILAGTETPADVAAIMSWFQEDPRRLLAAGPRTTTGGAAEDKKGLATDRTVEVAELTSGHAVPAAGSSDAETTGGASWQRFMEHVFSALREPRGPLGGTTAGRMEDDEDDESDREPANKNSDDRDVVIPRAFAAFEKLLDLLLSRENVPRHALNAFDLTQYVCERLQPDSQQAKNWLDRLLNALAHQDAPADRREERAAAILVMACHDQSNGARLARTRLIGLGFPLDGGPPSPRQVKGFQSVLTQRREFSETWEQIKKVRTFSEQIKSYLITLKTGQKSMEYCDLAKVAPEEWPALELALTSKEERGGILVLDRWSNACPKCHITLPLFEVSKLRTIGIATAKNCCRRILLYPGC